MLVSETLSDYNFRDGKFQEYLKKHQEGQFYFCQLLLALMSVLLRVIVGVVLMRLHQMSEVSGTAVSPRAPWGWDGVQK